MISPVLPRRPRPDGFVFFVKEIAFSPLRKSPNFGIMDALGRFEVRERSAAGVQTMWFEPWRPR